MNESLFNMEEFDSTKSEYEIWKCTKSKDGEFKPRKKVGSMDFADTGLLVCKTLEEHPNNKGERYILIEACTRKKRKIRLREIDRYRGGE